MHRCIPHSPCMFNIQEQHSFYKRSTLSPSSSFFPFLSSPTHSKSPLYTHLLPLFHSFKIMIPTEHDALIDKTIKTSTHDHSQQQRISHWRWFVLLVFSLLSFSSALMWDTFAPCLYIFVDYYFGSVTPVTVNAINAMSLVYMLLYPFAVQPTLHYFEDSKGAGTGLKRGVMIGASLNALGAAIRWLGRSPDRFMVLSVGQVVAAFGK